MLPCHIIGESGTLERQFIDCRAAINEVEADRFEIDLHTEFCSAGSAFYCCWLFRPFATNFHQASPMLEILVVMAVIAILMAKKRGKKFRAYIKGPIQNRFTLGTLAPVTLLGDNIDDSVTERAWLSSILCTWSMDEFTTGAGDGPILVGIAHSDYSDAEIEAWVEQTTGWDVGDLVSREISGRKIRRVGIFGSTGQALSGTVLNDGKPIRTKCGWMLNTGQSIRIWAYNQGSSALATTSPAVVTAGHANLWPR